MLSKEAKQALAKAIWSAIRSPTGEIDPDLMLVALNSGLPKHAILNAARVAREREAAKRKATQYKQQQLQQQQQPQQHYSQQQPNYSQQQHAQSALMPQSSMNHQHQHPNQSLSQFSQSHIGNQQQQAQLQLQRHHQHVSSQQQQQQQHSHHQMGSIPQPTPMPPQTNQGISIMSTSERQYRNQPQAISQYTLNNSSRSNIVQHQHQGQKFQKQNQQQAQQEQLKLKLKLKQQKLRIQQQLKEEQQQQQLKQQNLLKQQQRVVQVAKMSAFSGGNNNNNQSFGKTVSSLVKAKQVTVTAQQSLASKEFQLKVEERSKWKRVHHGIFMVQKGKFIAPPNTVSGMVRSKCQSPVLLSAGPSISSSRTAAFLPGGGGKLPRSILNEAAHIRKLLMDHKNNLPSVTITSLLNADKFKRIKIEPKRVGKALDRSIRSSRKSVADALNRQNKELTRAISSHQQEFLRFHKQKKTEAFKLARAIRDSANKETKRQEKDAIAAEKARLAALKANDMDAYSKLLEETKNDRLKFLMDKTERHFSEISTNILQTRTNDGSVESTGGTASYYASAHLKSEEIQQPSLLVGGDLKEYQLSGLQWMVSLYNNKLNGILADEMGLGKTIQAIALIAYLMEYKNNLGPYLVIVPLSTLSNWVNEFQKWCPSAHLICYKGIPSQRKVIYREKVKNGHFNVLLTTYEYIIKDKASLRKIAWQYAIVDEGHRMKNAASKFAKTLSSQYETKYRLLLTGTPLMNDLSELWSLLNFLLPSIFNSVDTFDQWFNRPFAQFGSSATNKEGESETNTLSNEERMFIIHRLHELLRPFMLRRVKSEVLDQLPEKVEKILRCELSSWQKELYKQISREAAAVNSKDSATGPKVASRGLNNAVMQLRKVCNHPYLFASQGYHINENIIRSSTKVDLLDRMLPKLRAAGHRVLLFTQMTAVMTILEDYFAYRNYLSLRLDGSTPAEEREKRMYKFNAPDSPYFIFLLSTRAGGLGLNLTSANTVIIFDSDWNPMMDLQAQDRAHRIGQRSDVSVFRMITQSPVEEKILSRATEKLNMSELVVEAGQFNKGSVENDNSLERKRMMEVLLTDFETNITANKRDSDLVPISNRMLEDKTKDFVGSEDGEIDELEDDDDNNSEISKEDDLNDLLSNNENDYQLYKSLDKIHALKKNPVDTSLFTSEDDIPDWIKYPSGTKDAALEDSNLPGTGSRKRKDVTYDDGLTEKQFLKLMDKKFDKEAADQKEKKLIKRGAKPAGRIITVKVPGTAVGESISEAITGSDLTDWAFRKLISCAKTVVALKEPSTKRRLCDVFLEKPSPEQFPDYYELIAKPIAINDILRKCRAKLYGNLQEFHDDWKLMFANAKQFNGEDSWVAEDGKTIKKELDRIIKKNGFAEEGTILIKPKTPPKKIKNKKLRIKLSLKSIKTDEGNSVEGKQVQDDVKSHEPVKKKRKKNSKET